MIPSERSSSSLLPLLDELGVGLRVFLARLPPRASGEPDERHKGVEAVTVAHGLVQIELGERRAALRAGEALVAEASSITAWRNVGESEAMLFWILRDPAPRRVVLTSTLGARRRGRRQERWSCRFGRGTTWAYVQVRARFAPQSQGRPAGSPSPTSSPARSRA